jgi:hypothetical protein
LGFFPLSLFFAGRKMKDRLSEARMTTKIRIKERMPSPEE